MNNRALAGVELTHVRLYCGPPWVVGSFGCRARRNRRIDITITLITRTLNLKHCPRQAIRRPGKSGIHPYRGARGWRHSGKYREWVVFPLENPLAKNSLPQGHSLPEPGKFFPRAVPATA
jgi:hypothetical protein